jgi:hypothetical protein
MELEVLERDLEQRLASVRYQERMRNDLPFFAAECLKIRTKSGPIAPLVLNAAQQRIHAALEEQKQKTGKVRALILKARQQGASTYIAARYFHRTLFGQGLRTFILAHEDSASQNLYEIVKRYLDNLPDPKPAVGTQNVKELTFSETDSGYKVASARTGGTGRSATVQNLHGSEVAFWLHAEDHAAGLLQAVPNEPGTEAVLESTANGPSGWFYSKWQEAEAGDADWLPIFTPWHISPEYRVRGTPDTELTAEERDYGQAWGLDAEQLLWRRHKIKELRDPLLFAQEYPINAAEAFVLSGTDAFISPATVVTARKAKNVTGGGPLVIGLDPAGTGGDRIAMAYRRGRICDRVETKTGIDTMEIVGWLVSVVNKEKPAAVFIDATGIGQGVYDRAREILGRVVIAVHNAGKPFRLPELDERGQPTGGPLNRRAECWQQLKEWLEDDGGASVPDRDDLHADLCSVRYSYDSSGRLKLERKEDMKKRGLRSPDLADALALTFAEPVSSTGGRVRGFNRPLSYPQSSVA